MSTFKVQVRRVEIEGHPNADALELAKIGDFRSCVRKGSFQTGDLVAYIPESALVPQTILVSLGLEGRLAGPAKNRVKAMRLRGVLSQGICLPAHPDWVEGQDVALELGITKWEPPIPTEFQGLMSNIGAENTISYDVENFRAFPDVLVDGEEVVFTEKVHGTCMLAVLVPTEDGIKFFVGSKGLMTRGLAFDPNRPGNENNVYCRAARVHDLDVKMRGFFGDQITEPVIVLGEVFGAGVQDLSYAQVSNESTIGFRVFDISTGFRSSNKFFSDAPLAEACEKMGLERVPVLYRGPFSRELMKKHTDGLETVSGKAVHIREGIVMRPTVERTHPDLRRVQLKSVSEAYLLRKDGTEFN